MSAAERCPREEELLDALGRGYVGAELDAHVTACEACTGLRSVAGALLDDRAAAMLEAPLPAAGTVWWRMRLRHRRDIEANARRSLVIGQAATLVIALALLISFFGEDVATAVLDLAATYHVKTSLLLAIATAVLVVPVAGWVAIRQK